MTFDLTLGDLIQILVTVGGIIVAVVKLSGKLDVVKSLFDQHVEHDAENFKLIRRDIDNLFRQSGD